MFPTRDTPRNVIKTVKVVTLLQEGSNHDKTYAAASYVSDQALTLSPVELDGLIFTDLFASLAVEIETAVLYDGNFGLDTLAASTGVTFFTGSSDTADVLASFAHALNAIATIRYNTANVIAITHPSVILHQTSHVDTTGRPIYLGDHSFNPAGIPGPVASLVRLCNRR